MKRTHPRKMRPPGKRKALRRNEKRHRSVLRSTQKHAERLWQAKLDKDCDALFIQRLKEARRRLGLERTVSIDIRVDTSPTGVAQPGVYGGSADYIIDISNDDRTQGTAAMQ